MNHFKIIIRLGYFLSLVLASCSSENGLRKFDSGDISKEISADIAKKFEIKDVSALAEVKKTTPKLEPIKVKSKKVVKMQESKTPPTRRIEPMPFLIGEKLKYDIRFMGVTAATFDLESLPEKVVNERKVYHFIGHAKTVKFFELVYRVNDHIESFWDFDGLYSHRFTMDLDESKQSRKLLELYDYEKNKSVYWNRIDHSEKGFSEQKAEYDIKPWSQDPISVLYYVRTLQLPKEPGSSVRVPVIMDGKPWEVVLAFDRKEKKSLGNREFNTNVYKLDTIQNGEVKNKDNQIWISDDEFHYVMRVEAKLKVGSFAIALDRIL